MANLSRKRRGELLRGLFDVLADYPGGIHAKDALAKTAKHLGLEHEQGSDADGAPRRST